MPESRRDEIASGLAEVRERIRQAAAGAGREPTDVTLVVVTKTWPASDLRLLHDLGVRDVGENRHQEAEEKAAELADLEFTWHFVGQVQSNKATHIAAYADTVHSVDSVRVAQRLNAGAHQHERELDCFIQVNLDPEAARKGRGGVVAAEVDDVAHAIETAGRLRLVGVMGVAPLDADAVAAYADLHETSERLVARYPSARFISAGMSGDFEAAIRAGATHVRVGSAVLGQRALLR
ncbi:MAG: YggS family pyridoxal phosphate-dependent enzyme [Nocardioidaceae bacterium]